VLQLDAVHRIVAPSLLLAARLMLVVGERSVSQDEEAFRPEASLDGGTRRMQYNIG
jgi:hypothetical protein